MVCYSANPAHKQEWLSTLGQSRVHWLKFILAFSARCELGSNNSHYPRVEDSAGQELGAKALMGVSLCYLKPSRWQLSREKCVGGLEAYPGSPSVVHTSPSSFLGSRGIAYVALHHHCCCVCSSHTTPENLVVVGTEADPKFPSVPCILSIPLPGSQRGPFPVNTSLLTCAFFLYDFPVLMRHCLWPHRFPRGLRS